MRFLNQKTGEILEADPLQLRLSRLRKRLSYYSSWVDYIRDVQGEEIDNIWIHLTYRPGVEWSSKHITKLIRKFKRILGSQLLGYYWVAEMQERGAVHFHIILTVWKGVRVPMPDKAGLWTDGSTKIQLIRYQVYTYMSKYINKSEQKKGYPTGIRIFGCVVYVFKKEVAENKLPSWLRDDIKERFVQAVEKKESEVYLSLINYQAYKKIKGGWKCGDQFFDSPYAIKDKFKKTVSASL